MNFIEEIPLFGPGAKVLVGTSLPLDQFCVYILPALPYTASVYEDTHGRFECKYFRDTFQNN